MHIRIRKEDKLDDLIILLLLLQIMIFPWLGIRRIINYIITILVLADIIKNGKKTYSSRILLVYVLFAFCIITNYIIFPGSITLSLKNTYRSFKAILIGDYFSRLLIRKPKYVIRRLKRLFVPLNAYLMLNIPVLLLQYSGWTWLASRDMSEAASNLAFDYYSGLFGLYGTPCLAIFCTMVFVYNLSYSRFFATPKVALRIRIWNLTQLSFFLVFSIINDNKFYYVEIVMYTIITLLSIYIPERNRDQLLTVKRKNRQRVALRLSLVGIGTIVLIIVAYTKIPKFTELIDLFVRKIKEGLDYSNAKGGGERIGMILYVLNSQNRYFGYGLARIPVEDGVLGFSHFGQGDIGTFMAFGGIIYVLILLFIVFLLFCRSYKKRLIPLLHLAAFMVMAIYTNAFHNTSTFMSIILIFLVCWIASHSYLIKQKDAL